MTPEHLRFGGGAGDTAILPLMALCLIVAAVLILALPREKAIIPFLMGFFTIPIGQVVVLGGFHFTGLRILILAGLAKRSISQGSSSEGKYTGGYNGIDQAAILWSVISVVAFLLQFMQLQALIAGLGTLLDTLGAYLVVRFLIPDRDAIRSAVKALAAVCVIQGIPMIGEHFTRINVFGYVAGVPVASAIRDGNVRAAGTLGALTAGPLAGMVVPLFIWLWKEEKSRMAAFAGLTGATAMVITSNSSTSTMALTGSLAGLAMWSLRKRMRQIRWGILCTLVGLHLKMKAPVWALIARVDLTGSSSSYQRYALVDLCIRHFSDWWLMGTPDYVNWGWDTFDLCNQFVAVAFTGGLLALIFYIAIFKRGFGAIGTARKLVDGDRKQEWFLWCLGSTMFGTLTAYFGIGAGEVLIIVFFFLAASISVAAFEARQPAVQSAQTSSQEQFTFGARIPGASLGPAR